MSGPAASPAAPESALDASARAWPSCGESWDDEDGGVSPYADACAIDERFGVFVDAAGGDDRTADGSRSAPFQTLTAAIAAAVHGPRRVYACAGVYEGPVRIGTELSDGLELLGGLSCETFLPEAAARSVVRAAAQGFALVIAETTDVLIERFTFENVKAAQAAPGTGYIGATVHDAQRIVLRDVTLHADDGEPGKHGVAVDEAAADGRAGSEGAGACSAQPNPGGGPTSNSACVMPFAVGGAGGPGGNGDGNGGGGNSGQGFVATRGEDGPGWACTPAGGGMGGTPQPGQLGAFGSGARGFGALVGGRFVGFGGQTGTDGGAGFGGVGGGGARAPATCIGLATPAGASGGGGGSSGCGGEGGEGGGPGGSSIGLLAIDADVRLERTHISYGNGGKGGDGASGQAGGKGGSGGRGGVAANGSNAACDGTAGGDGGAGGPGGGGQGGHAIGILYAGRAPALVQVSGESELVAHSGGDGGLGGAASTIPIDPATEALRKGAPGVSAFMFEF